MLCLAAVVRRRPRLAGLVERLESSQERAITWAGTPAGLKAHETFFLMVAFCLFGAVVGRVWGDAGEGWTWSLVGAIGGGALVPIRLRSLASERVVVLSHEFPSVIDLTSLSMNAGSDLPAAIARIVEKKQGVVADELQQFLMALDMGMTRRAALLALESRCPVDEVRDLVRAIVMAEQKGTSVALALAQQARSSRERRSVRAEESAARAGVLMMLPMMLLMGCLVILLVGPLVCQSSGF